MPLSPPNVGGTLTGVRNQCARNFGIAAYSSLGTQEQAAVDDGIGFGLDRVSREADAQWIRREAALSTVVPYSAGTLSTTVGSTTVTGVGTAWIANVLAGDKIDLGDSGFYRVASTPTVDTTLVLASAYAGASALSGVTYEITRDTFTLAAGMLWLESIRDIESAQPLTMLSEVAYVELARGRYTTGTPVYAVLRGADASGASPSGTNQGLQFWPLPDARYAYVYTYLTVPTFPSTGTDALEVYPHLSDLLVLAAMQYVWTQLGDADRAGQMEAAYQTRLLTALKREGNRTNRQIARMRPQWGPRGPVSRWPINFPPTVVSENTGAP